MLTPTPKGIEKLFIRLHNGSHTDEITGCVVWDGGVNKDGYGRIEFCGGRRIIHRLVWILLKGPTDLLVCHKCDNPRCWNIEHLWIGTDEDNHWDARRKGRKFPGWAKKGTTYPTR